MCQGKWKYLFVYFSWKVVFWSPLFVTNFYWHLSFHSFLVDACMKLLAHVDTEGLFRKSGSVIRLKALRVSDGWSWPWCHWILTLGTISIQQCLFCVCVCVGKTWCRRRVPIDCSSMRCGRSGEAVLQGTARACDTHRAAGSLPEGSAAPHRGGENLCNPSAVLYIARQKSKCPASLFWFSLQRFSEVSLITKLFFRDYLQRINLHSYFYALF